MGLVVSFLEMQLLCRLGLHRWGEWQEFTDSSSSDEGGVLWRICKRCGAVEIIMYPGDTISIPLALVEVEE